MIIRKATESDIDSVNVIFTHHKKFVGFVMKVTLQESVQKGRLLVAENGSGEVVGAVNFCPTKKGYITIYEVASMEKGVGRLLIEELKKLNMDIKLKVTEDNDGAFAFYKKVGFEHVTTEQGKKRKLHVMYLRNSKQKKLF